MDSNHTSELTEHKIILKNKQNVLWSHAEYNHGAEVETQYNVTDMT